MTQSRGNNAIRTNLDSVRSAEPYVKNAEKSSHSRSTRKTNELLLNVMSVWKMRIKIQLAEFAPNQPFQSQLRE